MFVGHGLLAFALVAFAGERLGWERRTVLGVAVLAALFGTLPDIDVVYAPVGLLLGADLTNPVESFWTVGNEVHRGVIHSLVVGAVTAAAAVLLARKERLHTVAGVAILASVLALATLYSGGLAGVVTLVFALGAIGLVALAGEYDIAPRHVGGAALVGLLTHPFGDLVTGSPPALLYPFDVTLVAERVALSGDTTLHLLGAFWLELAVVWLALVAYFRLTDRRVGDYVERPAAVGVVYGAAALVLPAPTLDVSYHFVYSVLGIGLLGGVTSRPLARPTWRAVVTALAAVSVASLSYAVVYLVV
jgi:membrane-bound metal-dependent hydrolase YbcI (DUF457 family)